MKNAKLVGQQALASRWLGLTALAVVLAVCPNLQNAGTSQSPERDGLLPEARLPNEWSPNAGVDGSRGAVVGSVTGGAAAGDWIAFPKSATDGGQIITLINTSREWMAVYHVDGTGHIHLVGSRPLTQDFAVQYNAVAPLPEDIRRIAMP